MREATYRTAAVRFYLHLWKEGHKANPYRMFGGKPGFLCATCARVWFKPHRDPRSGEWFGGQL